MALAPATQCDAGVQLFNAMGMEVLLYEVSAILRPRPAPDRGLADLLKVEPGWMSWVVSQGSESMSCWC